MNSFCFSCGTSFGFGNRIIFAILSPLQSSAGYNRVFQHIAKFYLRHHVGGTLSTLTLMRGLFLRCYFADKFFKRSSRRHFELGLRLEAESKCRAEAANFRRKNLTAVLIKNLSAKPQNNQRILFAPHAFVSQSQEGPSALPSPLVFRTISTDFTPTPCAPCTSNPL